MDVSIVSKVTIAATPKAVFRYLQHLRYHYLWNPHLRKIAPLQPLRQGMTYRTESILLGITVHGSNTVTKLVHDRELQIENSTGSIHYSVNYTLKGQHKGVVLACTTNVSTQSPALRFTAKVLQTLARRELQSDLQALKIAVEQQLASQ